MPDDRSVQARLDQIAAMISANSERLASMEATLIEWRLNQERFYAQVMPRIERDLAHTGERLTKLENDIIGLRGRVAMMSAAIGAAFAGAMGWLKHTLGWN